MSDEDQELADKHTSEAFGNGWIFRSDPWPSLVNSAFLAGRQSKEAECQKLRAVVAQWLDVFGGGALLPGSLGETIRDNSRALLTSEEKPNV